MPNPDAEWFTDGSSFMKEEYRISVYATVSREKLIESGTLYAATTSALKAELFAITRDLELGKGLQLNIFTQTQPMPSM